MFVPQVNLNVKQGGKRLEHQGIRIEFVGQIGEHDIVFYLVAPLTPQKKNGRVLSYDQRMWPV